MIPSEQVQVVGANIGQRWEQLNQILVILVDAINALDARVAALETPPDAPTPPP